MVKLKESMTTHLSILPCKKVVRAAVDHQSPLLICFLVWDVGVHYDEPAKEFHPL